MSLHLLSKQGFPCSYFCSYFSVYALEHFYLHSPVHSKFINKDVLQRYLPVGGCRIEDDLLITSKGYENLTTAPKGDAMLDIIRRGKADDVPLPARRLSMRAQTGEDTVPRLRAPGISTDNPESILKPLARASTMPAEYQPRKSVDFEPFEGPSLFSNFKRSMTTDERIRRWQLERDAALVTQEQTKPQSMSTVCGNDATDVKHVFLTSGTPRSTNPYSLRSELHLPACKKCTILCEALDRLRQNLNSTEQSPTRQTKPAEVVPPPKQEAAVPQTQALPLRQRSTLPPRRTRHEKIHFSNPNYFVSAKSTNPFRHAPATEQNEDNLNPAASLRRHHSVPGPMNAPQQQPSSRSIQSRPTLLFPPAQNPQLQSPAPRPNPLLERARARRVASEAALDADAIPQPAAPRILSQGEMRALRTRQQREMLQQMQNAAEQPAVAKLDAHANADAQPRAHIPQQPGASRNLCAGEMRALRTRQQSAMLQQQREMLQQAQKEACMRIGREGRASEGVKEEY